MDHVSRVNKVVDKIVPLSVSFLFVILLLFFLCVLFVIIKEKWGNC